MLQGLLKSDLECEIKSNWSRFLCILHIQNSSYYANGILNFQDDYNCAKDFKTGRNWRLIFCVIIAQHK